MTEPQHSEPQPTSGRRFLKWGCIGCGGLVGFFLLLGIIGAFAVGGDTEDTTSLGVLPTATASPQLASETEETDTTAVSPTETTEFPHSETPDPEMNACTDPASNAFLRERNEITMNAIPQLDLAETALQEIRLFPVIGVDEMWVNTATSSAEALDRDGRQLTSSDSVPAYAVDLQEHYDNIGGNFIDLAQHLHNAATYASVHPPGPWEKSADEAEDILDDIADQMEELQEEILELCE